MTHKLIKDMDEQLWRRFVAYCALKGTTVGKELSVLIQSHLKQKLKEAFK